LNVRQSAELFFQRREDLGAGAAAQPNEARADAGRGRHPSAGHDANRGQQQSKSPVHPKQQRQNADKQDSVADDRDDEAGEEIGERRHVAVDPLDQLAGLVSLMKAKVELEAMLGQVGPEGVRCEPADVLGDISFRDRDALDQQRDRQELDGRRRERLDRDAGLGPVDE